MSRHELLRLIKPRVTTDKSPATITRVSAPPDRKCVRCRKLNVGLKEITRHQCGYMLTAVPANSTWRCRPSLFRPASSQSSGGQGRKTGEETETLRGTSGQTQSRCVTPTLQANEEEERVGDEEDNVLPLCLALCATGFLELAAMRMVRKFQFYGKQHYCLIVGINFL